MQDCITRNLKPTIRSWVGKQVVKKKKKRVESMRMLYALPTHLVVGNKLDLIPCVCLFTGLWSRARRLDWTVTLHHVHCPGPVDSLQVVSKNMSGNLPSRSMSLLCWFVA